VRATVSGASRRTPPSFCECPEQRRQGKAVDLPVANQVAHAVDGDPFEPLDLVRVRGSELLCTRADADADSLVADAR